MAYKLQLKRGASGSLPTGSAGEPLFTTDTNDLYIGTGGANQRFQKYIASGTSAQFLKGDGSLDSGTYQPQLNGTGFVKISGTTISYDNTSYLPLTGGTLSSASSAETLRLINTGTGYGLYNQSDSYFQGDVKFQSVSNTILKVDSSNKLIAAVAGTDYQAPITNPVTGTGTTNYLPKWTSGSALGNSLVYDNGTAIGIGTTSPSEILHLQSTAPVIRYTKTGILNWYAGNVVGNNYTIYPDSATSSVFNITSTGNLLVNSSTDNGNRLQVTGNGYFSGNVGIGTSSPATKVDISYADNSYLAGLTVTNTTNNTQAQSKINIVNSAGTVLSLMSQSPSVNGGRSFITTSDTTTLTFGVNYLEKMYLTSSGNLGLSVVPSAWGSAYKALQIAQSSFAGATLYSWVGNNWVDDGTGNKYIANGFSTLYEQRSGEHRFLTAPSGTAGNAITFTQAMTLDASGNLGLGATSPAAKLDVVGSAGIRVNEDGAGTKVISIRSNFAGVDPAINVSTNNALLLQTNNTERARITSGGNLLLNTTTDSGERLVVNGSANVNGLFVISNSTGIPAQTASLLRLASGFASPDIGRMYIGDGTGWKFHFSKRIASTTTDIITFFDTGAATFSSSVTSGGDIIFTNTNNSIKYGSSRFFLYNATNTYIGDIDGLSATASLILRTNGTDKVTLTSGGNLLVGTSTDVGERFQVSGKAYINNGGGLYIDPNASNTIFATTGARPLYFEVNGANRMVIKSNGVINMGYLPTSSAGLSAGDIWNDGGTLKIV